MYLLPHIEKLQKEINELKVTLKEKDNIINTTRGDLVKLNSQKNEMELKVGTLQQKLDSETAKLKGVQAAKERVEQHLNDAINNNQTLHYSV